jgi:hypothetical protein
VGGVVYEQGEAMEGKVNRTYGLSRVTTCRKKGKQKKKLDWHLHGCKDTNLTSLTVPHLKGIFLTTI